MINTLTGQIKKEDVGFALPHEHILCDLRPFVDHNNPDTNFKDKVSLSNRHYIYSDPYLIEDNAVYLDEDVAVNELELFKKSGGKTIFDCTTFFRNPEALKRISERTGVNVVLGCGFYVDEYIDNKFRKMSVPELSKLLVKELTVGMDDTNLKAGFIGEIGTSMNITEQEWKSVLAAGYASLETDAPIHFHTSLWEENGLTIVDKLLELGVKPEKICIDHIDVFLRSDYILKLLDKGVYVEYDDFGKEYFLPKRDTGALRGRFAYDYERCLSIKEMVDKGYTDKILITTDCCLKSLLATYGGNGFGHIGRNITAMLKDVGLTEKQVKTLTNNNPANFFDR